MLVPVLVSRSLLSTPENCHLSGLLPRHLGVPWDDPEVPFARMSVFFMLVPRPFFYWFLNMNLDALGLTKQAFGLRSVAKSTVPRSRVSDDFGIAFRAFGSFREELF